MPSDRAREYAERCKSIDKTKATLCLVPPINKQYLVDIIQAARIEAFEAGAAAAREAGAYEFERVIRPLVKRAAKQLVTRP